MMLATHQTSLILFLLAGAVVFARSVIRIGYAGAAVIAARESEGLAAFRQFAWIWVELLAGGGLFVLCAVQLAESIFL